MAFAVCDSIIALIYILLVIGDSTGIVVHREKSTSQGVAKKQDWMSGRNQKLPVNCTAYNSIQLKKRIGKVSGLVFEICYSNSYPF